MQAVILAAGMGKRLKNLTRDCTKCMIKVNGVTLIERMLQILDKKGLSKIILVVGYKGDRLVDYVSGMHMATPVSFIDNPVYDRTNNIYSLLLAKEYLMAEDTLLLESDLIFEESVIDLMLHDSRETLALVDKFESWMDGSCVVLGLDDSICDFIPGRYLKFSEQGKYYKTVNIYKFSRHFSKNIYVPLLEAYEKVRGDNEYYESVIKLIIALNVGELRAKRLCGQKWYEIDDVQDLDIAESLFADAGDMQYQAVVKRYGGYWRYPKLLDFCYLVNPYYPPEQMLVELRSNFDVLLKQYPSGMGVNCLLAAKNFGVDVEEILVGNGAAELISGLMDIWKGKTGFIRPTFDEYPNRCAKERRVCMTVQGEDFSYSAGDIIAFFEKNPVNNLVVINPDNPSGNYIEKKGILELISWCREKEINLAVDESFVDFADCGCSLEELTLISESVLKMYEGLFVIKSISKSYGVPGIRLGILASANREALEKVRKTLPIWNINSIGEFYMQIEGKYRKDYSCAVEKIRDVRKKFADMLSEISFLRVIPTQANYMMCEVIHGMSSREICIYLLGKNILIKDLTGKIGNGKQYVRLAVRREEENRYLADCLEDYDRQSGYSGIGE